jgi:adenine-specific DNA-methyltransferase
MTTPYHAKFWAQSLLLAHPPDGVDGLSRSIGNARVDLNPHQVDAALFALRSPYSKGVLLADEVGLGKTIEAALILAQKWAERRRRILLIVPATLRKQWQMELEDKFFLPSTILEAKSANALAKKGIANPFLIDDRIVICSYQFVYAKRAQVQQIGWDLVVVDEAHRLRSIYKGTKTAEGIVDAIRPARKLLLTATPLQNSLLELYGLVSILDPELFGGQEAFLSLGT